MLQSHCGEPSQRSRESSTGQGVTANAEHPFAADHLQDFVAGHLQDTVGLGNERQG
jgi:hypothetical protein